MDFFVTNTMIQHLNKNYLPEYWANVLDVGPKLRQLSDNVFRVQFREIAVVSE